ITINYPGLTSLRMSSKMSGYSSSLLEPISKRLTKLKRLDVSDCSVFWRQDVFSCVKALPLLESLSLRNTMFSISASDNQSIKSMIASSPQLKELDLSYIHDDLNFSVSGARLTNFRKLNFSFNPHLKDNGVSAILSSLKNCGARIEE